MCWNKTNLGNICYVAHELEIMHNSLANFINSKLESVQPKRMRVRLFFFTTIICINITRRYCTIKKSRSMDMLTAKRKKNLKILPAYKILSKVEFLNDPYIEHLISPMKKSKKQSKEANKKFCIRNSIQDFFNLANF
jgi:hypothetical protein